MAQSIRGSPGISGDDINRGVAQTDTLKNLHSATSVGRIDQLEIKSTSHEDRYFALETL
jgi:hypothetical protein